MSRRLCIYIFALSVSLTSTGQGFTPKTEDCQMVEIVPGAGAAPELPYWPKFKNRDFAEGWCEGYNKAAVLSSQLIHDDLVVLAKAHNISPEVDKLILTFLDEAALRSLRLSLKTEDDQTVECK